MANDVLSGTVAPQTRSVTSFLQRHAVVLFGALLLLTLPAFWRSYFFPPKVEYDYHVHFHGIAMFLWVILLVSQAALIRTHHRTLHRRMGKAAWVLGPAIVVSTVLLANFRLKQAIDAELLWFFYLQIVLLAIFSFAFVQAMRHRHSPALHARYMVCTALAIFDPIVARVLFFQIGTAPPFVQVATFAMIDLILLALIALERGRERGAAARVFPAMLAVFVLAQIPQFFVTSMPWWRDFAAWYGSLPMP